MPRKTPEWIGKTPDSKVPDRVKLRVLEAYDRTCYLSQRPIRPGDKWEVEHKVAIILGGENRESNLAPALIEFHKAKTKAEMKVKSKIAAVAKAAYGIKPKGRGFPRRPKAERPKRDKLPMPGPDLSPIARMWRAGNSSGD